MKINFFANKYSPLLSKMVGALSLRYNYCLTFVSRNNNLDGSPYISTEETGASHNLAVFETMNTISVVSRTPTVLVGVSASSCREVLSG